MALTSEKNQQQKSNTENATDQRNSCWRNRTKDCVLLKLFISQSKIHKANSYFLIAITVWEEASPFSIDTLFERFIMAIETVRNFLIPFKDKGR